MKKTALLLLALLGTLNLRAEVKTKVIEYKLGDTVLEGFHAYDDAIPGKRPAILVVHQWMGLGDYEKKRAEMLAKMGYNVFALDIYGKGVRPGNPQAAGAMAGKYKADRQLLRDRAAAGLAELKKLPQTDATKIAAIGYCFGGTTVLELARAGTDIAGVVSFHGGLGTPKPEDAKNIKCKVIALHGADDPFVPVTEVTAFEEEMRQAKVDWQLVAFGGAVHGFTMAGAGDDNSKGMAYNEKADKRSWEIMQQFFGEIFK